jgi:poly(3-hydroxybutyrate) depolymerase
MLDRDHAAASWRATLRAALLALTLAVVAAGCIPAAGTQPISSAPQPAGCIQQVGPTVKMVVAGCGGDVTYNVSVPDQCMTHACGLIVDVHGWTMSGDIQEANTGIAAIGREEGYVVIQPNAPGDVPSWSSAHYPHVASFVELALDVWRIDRRRVHITGFSQGGAMTFWMRCNRPDLFVSAAPTAMSGSACANGVNIPTLYLQGHDDVFISEANIAATIASFRNRHGLTEVAVASSSPEVTTTLYYSDEPGVTPFVTVLHNYSTNGLNGHCVMGSATPTSPYGCDQPALPGHGRIIVDFFKNQARAS